MRVLVAALVSMLVAVGAGAQDAPFSDLPLVQNTGAVDRGAAGSGSMGMGKGIEYLDDEKADERDDSAQRRSSSVPPRSRTGEPGHGDNETDMEHHPRPRLERHRDR
ncbi:hypothetical protein CXK94_10135 [Stutzerimonas stutzeri]|uniref:Uncharacterized protein n=1 Tax=Stutzerimonas stutzeri TaxID=316 RepID=A0A2N8T594_STUST|nr:hypothetical protein [Stutzerimonas stutzeri]MCQ4325210.1 hypothetical protein [Stutzerimonas stutzeri]PNG09893.1 hypothetical protein CXK94_10135 [Stutzerimonas stutzeri]